MNTLFSPLRPRSWNTIRNETTISVLHKNLECSRPGLRRARAIRLRQIPQMTISDLFWSFDPASRARRIVPISHEHKRTCGQLF